MHSIIDVTYAVKNDIEKYFIFLFFENANWMEPLNIVNANIGKYMNVHFSNRYINSRVVNI